jgi:AcrR family transcriptional regulator
MPRIVDRAERRREIAYAALRLMSTRGPAALTLRGLAEELGGSITLVTHFYRNRAELLKGIADQLIDDYDADLADLEKGADEQTRLRVLLEWMLPLTLEARNDERARVLLNAERQSDLHVQYFFEAMDQKMRALLRDHVRPLVEPANVDVTVDALRVLVNGVVLSAVEHPRKWPSKRQLALLDHILGCLGLQEPEPVLVSGDDGSRSRSPATLGA